MRRIQLLTDCFNPQRRFVQPVLREVSFQVLPMKWKSRLLSQVVLTQTPSRIVILKTPTFRCWFSTIEDWDTLQAFNKTCYSVNPTPTCLLMRSNFICQKTVVYYYRRIIYISNNFLKTYFFSRFFILFCIYSKV